MTRGTRQFALNVEIRLARATDAAAIAELANGVIRDTTITFTTRERTEEDVANRIASGQPHWVAVSGDRVGGFASFAAFRAGPGYAHTVEHSILLSPEARGQGVGRSLMKALQLGATQSRAHSLIAAISGENDAAVAFHTALGFAHVGRIPEAGWKFGRWHDLVLMQKRLPAPGPSG